MALFTKLFDRSHEPYSIPGARWVKIRLYTDGSASGDLLDEIAGTSSSVNIMLKPGYTVINAVAYMKGHYTGTASSGSQLTVYAVHYPDGRDAVRMNTTLSALVTNYPDGFEIYAYVIKRPPTPV